MSNSRISFARILNTPYPALIRISLATGPGVYRHDHNEERILLVTKTSLNPAIKPGTYIVKESNVVPPDSIRVNIYGQLLNVVEKEQIIDWIIALTCML